MCVTIGDEVRPSVYKQTKRVIAYLSAMALFVCRSMDNLHYEKFADDTIKCIEDEIPFPVPDGWAWTRLKGLFTVCSSKRVLQSDWKKNGIPFYRAREIVELSDSNFVDNELFISEKQFHTLSKNYSVPLPGDLMVSGVGTIGKVYIVKPKDRFYYKDASVLCFENRSGFVIPEFARILLESEFIQKQMKDNSKGTTVDTITISTAMNYLCIIPPIKEQIRIISVVQHIVNQTNIIHERKKGLQTLVTSAKEKILDLAIRGKLVPQNDSDEPASVLLERIRVEKEELIKQGKIKRDKRESVIYRGTDNSYYERFADGSEKCIDEEIPFEIPGSWEWERLSNVASFSGGKTPSTSRHEYWGNDVPWITSKDMKSKYISSSQLYLSSLGAEQLKIYSSNTLLVCVRSGILRHTFPIAILKIDATINQDLKAIKLYLPELLEYIYVCLKGLESNILRKNIKSGTTVESINFYEFKKILLPIPSLDEQQRIVEYIKKCSDNIDMIDMLVNKLE